jgi:hypothetical protein
MVESPPVIAGNPAVVLVHLPVALLAVMSSHPMNRPAPISVFSDQRRTKSTI